MFRPPKIPLVLVVNIQSFVCLFSSHPAYHLVAGFVAKPNPLPLLRMPVTPLICYLDVFLRLTLEYND